MNSRIYGILKIVYEEKNLGRILKKSRISDYLELQYSVGPGMLVFSDDNMDNNTTVSLTDPCLSEYETFQRVTRADIKSTVALILSGIAIISEILIHVFISG